MSGISDTNRLARLFDHTVAPGLVYPSLAAGATLLSGVANWTWSVAYNPIVPANTIHTLIHIHTFTIETCDVAVDAVYQIELYSGVGHDLVCGIPRFSTRSVSVDNQVYVVPSALVGPNLQIDARCASSDGLAHPATFTVSIGYTIED